MNKSTLPAFLLLIPLLSCTFFTLVPPNGSTTVKDVYKVNVESAWNAHQYSDALLWTQNGLGLDQLVFFNPAEDGKALASPLQWEGKRLPVYKKTMTMLELPDLMKESLLGIGYFEVTVEKVLPTVMSGGKALRMEYSAKMENGPTMKGFAVMCLKGERLYSVAFSAEETAYYPLVAPSAERVIASLTLVN
jgi:hypothetical protein